MKSIFYHPVIIIGAARSGTNMLRDILTQLPGFGTWPCDEINYIWRHGNVKEPSDELNPKLATEPVKRFIRGVFDQLAQKYGLTHVVEKTCANSLRVGFVDTVFPEAKYINIIRDGRDVAVSAQKRWTAPLDLSYIMRKARFVPLTDIPYYAFRYLWSRIYRTISPERRLAFWGPRFIGMEQALQQYSLAEVCAIQWQRSVEKAVQEFAQIDPSRVFHLRYEDFVTQPDLELQRLGDFLGTKISQIQSKQLTQGVLTKSVGRWKTELDQKTLTSIETLLEETLKQYDYPLFSA